ncbi:hypothetical protein A2379_01910 [Candidatus Amesbacteria bacterium RIFOXYB1_FULL_47_13]|nr:MAG: hypothetical protein A2379_01910 [Candidatus Amesbacteria bacterium RIFOXYB1_FULL_47_13]HBC72710.1 metallopeptidase [Candidatus Amesbacteria bacterium]
MQWKPAPDIASRISFLVSQLRLTHIRAERIICFRSQGSQGRSTARIWSLPRIWQIALDTPPHYCLEVIAEKFDRLSLSDQEKVLIHELIHVPKTFSGALVPHRSRLAGRRTFRHYHDLVDQLYYSLSVKSYE